MSSPTTTPASPSKGLSMHWHQYIGIGIILLFIIWLFRRTYLRAEKEQAIIESQKEQNDEVQRRFKEKAESALLADILAGNSRTVAVKDTIMIDTMYYVVAKVGVWETIPNDNHSLQIEIQDPGQKFLFKNSCGTKAMIVGDGKTHTVIPCPNASVQAIGEEITIPYKYVPKRR